MTTIFFEKLLAVKKTYLFETGFMAMVINFYAFLYIEVSHLRCAVYAFLLDQKISATL